MQHSDKWRAAMAKLKGSGNPMFRNAKLSAYCETCGKHFSFYRGSSTGKYCSRDCHHKNPAVRQQRSESARGRTMSAISRAKMSKARKGVPKPKGFGELVRRGLKRTWDSRGRKSDLYTLVKSSLEFRQWREEVFRRSNGECTACGRRASKLDAHHIIPFSVLLAEHELGIVSMNEIHDPSNGVALCRPCHKEVHKHGSRFNQLPEGRLFIAIKAVHREQGEGKSLAQFYREAMETIIVGVKNNLKPV